MLTSATCGIGYRIVVISLKLVLHVNHWNWVVHVSVWGSFLVYLGLSSAVNVIYSFYPLFAAQYFAFCTPWSPFLHFILFYFIYHF
jgi:hypothetical protein